MRYMPGSRPWGKDIYIYIHSPVRLMMEASPAPMTILHASRVQKLLAKPQPTDDTVKMAMPHPVTTPQTDHVPLQQLIMHACR